MSLFVEPDSGARSVASLIQPPPNIVTSLGAAWMAVTADPSLHLVVIGPTVDLESVLDFAARVGDLADHDFPVQIVLVRSQLNRADLDVVRNAGIQHVVYPASADGVAGACARALAGEEPRDVELGPEVDATGRVITVFSAKGGTGKTTMATNLAVALNADGERRVCLVDLDLAFGDVAISMQMTPKATILDAVGAETVDSEVVRRIASNYRPGLDCILAPVEPGDSERIPPSLIRGLLTALRAEYEYVVIDTPAQFTEHVLLALDDSHHHVLLTTPEIPALKNLRLTLDMMDLLNYDREARLIVFNRANSRVGLTAADVEKVVKSPIAAHVPSSIDVPASINRGVPLVAENPKHPVSQAIAQFASEFVVGDAVGSAAKGKRGFKFVRRSS